MDSGYMSERYLVLRQHEYASPKYWALAEVESPDNLKEESIQDEIAHARVFSDDEAEIILVRVIGEVSADQTRMNRILEEMEKEDDED